MDPATIMFGLQALQGIAAGSANRSATRVRNTLRQAEVYSANTIRAARNENSAAQAQLGRFNQNLANNRVVEDTASVMEANAANYLRARDGQIEDSLDDQIAFAEQAGAQAAAGAASGLVGGVVDMVASTTALRRSRIEGAQTQRLKEFEYDQKVNQKQTLLQGLSAMDNSTILADIDYGIDTFMAEKSPSGGVLMDILGSVDASIAQATLGYFSSKPTPKVDYNFFGSPDRL